MQLVPPIPPASPFHRRGAAAGSGSARPAAPPAMDRRPHFHHWPRRRWLSCREPPPSCRRAWPIVERPRHQSPRAPGFRHGRQAPIIPHTDVSQRIKAVRRAKDSDNRTTCRTYPPSNRFVKISNLDRSGPATLPDRTWKLHGCAMIGFRRHLARLDALNHNLCGHGGARARRIFIPWFASGSRAALPRPRMPGSRRGLPSPGGERVRQRANR